MVVATRPQNRRSHINPRGIGVVLRDRAQLIRGFRAHQCLITKGDIDDSRPVIGRFFGRIGRVVAIGGGSLSSPEKNRSGEGEAQGHQTGEVCWHDHGRGLARCEDDGCAECTDAREEREHDAPGERAE